MIDGIVLVGWILATVAFAGLYGAVRNETWVSVLHRTINPSVSPVRITQG